MRCTYCGVSLVVESPVVGERKTLYTVMLELVGPSNRAGVARVIARHAELDAADAETLVSRTPCEVVAWEEHGRADEFRRALSDAGAGATLGTRVIELPPPVRLPPLRVTLDAVGDNRVVVLKVIREHLACGFSEARHLVDSAPCDLVASLDNGRAVAFRDALVDAGAQASTIALRF